MSGHSKWSTIKRKKGAADAKRANVFTKLARVITVAAKAGKNLDLAVEQAKAANMPKENIQRAIDKGTGKLAGEQIEELTYEAYGPGGVAIIIKVLTDNKNRSLSNIRSVMNKFGGRIADSGSVSYLFEQKGVIVIKLSNPSTDLGVNNQVLSKEDVELIIIDSGAEDYVEDEGYFYVYTKPKDLEKVKKSIEFRAVKIESAKLEMVPKSYISISENIHSPIVKLLEALEEEDDVSEVYTNADL